MPRRVNAHRSIESVCFSLTNPRQFGIMLKWLFMLFAAVVMAFVAMRANAADLLVTVDGVRNASGEVRFALFDKPDEFPTGEKLQGQEEAAKEGKVQTVFKNLPPGAYAIAVHHDENSDNEMNLDVIWFKFCDGSCCSKNRSTSSHVVFHLFNLRGTNF